MPQEYQRRSCGLIRENLDSPDIGLRIVKLRVLKGLRAGFRFIETPPTPGGLERTVNSSAVYKLRRRQQIHESTDFQRLFLSRAGPPAGGEPRCRSVRPV